MENTEDMIFRDTTPKWFIALHQQTLGPFTGNEIYQKILKNELSWAHYVWTPGKSEWERICDTAEFKPAVPQSPQAGLIEKAQAKLNEQKKPVVKKISPPQIPSEVSASVREWFLYYNDSQFGPFNHAEIMRSLEIGKINPRVHIWKEGFEGWVRIESLDAFKKTMPAGPPPAPSAPEVTEEIQTESSNDNPVDLHQNEEIVHTEDRSSDVETDISVSESKETKEPKQEQEAPRIPTQRPVSHDSEEQRLTPRAPLVARVLMTDEGTIMTGICRDISVGGMQVLTDRIPGPVGTEIKLNVSPSGGVMSPFVAMGKIVRWLEDGRGFSFRFYRLDEESMKAIEEYIRG